MRRVSGKLFLLLIFLLNVPGFFLIPWENYLFDKEAVVARHMENPIEVDVADLEPTGIYLCMDHRDDYMNGYEDPKWIHFRAYAYAQFYIYTGEVPRETQMWLHGFDEYDGPEPILIVDSVIDIPESGTVMLDLSEINFLQWGNAQRAVAKVQEKYGLKHDKYIDCATPYCEELTAFKTKKFNLFIGTVAVESILGTIVLVIVSIVAYAKSGKNNAQ